jgi:hypothetical protein
MSTQLVQSELVFAVENEQSQIVPAFYLTETGIEIDEDISYDQWVKGLKAFKWMQKRVKTAFSEYLDFGKLKFGKEKVDDALGQLEFEMVVVNEAKHIGNVPEAIKDKGLSAEHLVVLGRSNIDDKAKAKWAATAAKEKLTPTQLKASIKEGQVVNVSVARAQTHGVITLHAVKQEFMIWFNRMGGLDKILALDKDSLKEIKEQLEEMVDLYSYIEAKLK